MNRSRDGGRPDRGEGDMGSWRNSEADNASSWRRTESYEASRPEPRRYETRGPDRSWGDSVADSESTWRRSSPNVSDDRRRYGGRDSERRGPDREADSASSWRSDPSSFRSREEGRQETRSQLHDGDRYTRSAEEGREERKDDQGMLFPLIYLL